jgi:hypothetical protein
MTFERLVRDKRFASELTTTAIGRLRLTRPTEVVIVNARVDVDRTAELLVEAHARAIHEGSATMLHGLAIPFVGFEGDGATEVKPDFAVVVARRAESDGEDVRESWLIVGDAKDYERVRSRIDDPRLLKGFLQVALGAESADRWTRLPAEMSVHPYGALAVPRNAFLQPEALVEALHDHREEVRMRVDQRRHEADVTSFDEDTTAIADYVNHLDAAFDPAACVSCTLFSFCRAELRTSGNPQDLLVEIGIPKAQRPAVAGLIDGDEALPEAAASARAQVVATLAGVAQWTGQARVDQAGQPGSVNVVLAKSDSAALGVYGIATQRVTRDGADNWKVTVFDDPQSVDTRRAIMKLIGADLTIVLKDRRLAEPDGPGPVHLVVPDAATADVLASIADNLAGVELSRLRWRRDKEMGRPALTFNGEAAQIPPALPAQSRMAVSFLLEEDRARALTLRSPIVDVRAALGCHVLAGGPAVSALRLDYIVAWARATPDEPLDHRALSDEIEAEEHTPGARLTNRRSDAIHAAFIGPADAESRPAEPERYYELIQDELGYKTRLLEAALASLDAVPDSVLREVHRAIEGDAQAVWRRRHALHASDLVRFGRTYRHWRNALVPTIEADARCAAQLIALANPQAAIDLARDAGVRHVASARVVATDPLTLGIDSRRIGHESRIVLLHVNGQACVETSVVQVAFQKGSFKLDGLSIGAVEVLDADRRHFVWSPVTGAELVIGDELVIADFAWFGTQLGNRQLPVDRPGPDTTSAPKLDCAPESYGEDPAGHAWCCRPHEVSEADWSDELAARRARGELNPEVWPPVVDDDAFEVSPSGAAVGDAATLPAQPVPDDVTADDLD